MFLTKSENQRDFEELHKTPLSKDVENIIKLVYKDLKLEQFVGTI